MRLTGLPEITARVFRAAGASGTEKVNSPAAAKGVHSDSGIGVATTISSTDQTPPFNADRVAEIREALKEGRYPLVPAQIADAMIAAKLYGIVEA